MILLLLGACISSLIQILSIEINISGIALRSKKLIEKVKKEPWAHDKK